MGRNHWLALPFLVVITLLVIWPRFGQVIQHPDAYLFAEQGDGLKNYFVFSYYLRYDKGLAFSGLNYPYGDNLLFTDSHPFLAWSLNQVDEYIYPLSSHPVAILNLMLVIGMLLSVVFLFLVLRHFQLPIWYSAIIALAIFFLSPQVDRINGHLSLSHAFVIPMIWWILLRAEARSASRWWYVVLGLSLFLVGGIHLYFTAICSTFLLAYLVCKWFFKTSSISDFWRSHRMLFISTLTPLVAFLILASMVDPFSDRPISPYGFYVYHASLASVFLPYQGAITDFVTTVFRPRMNWEGRAFIGSLPLLFFFFWLVRIVVKSFQRIMSRGTGDTGLFTIVPSQSMKERELFIHLAAACLVLLFSMCVPFEWGLQFIVETLAPLKQFRALGRFSWVFYYVVSICAAYHLYKGSQQLRRLRGAWFYGGLLTAISAIWLLEGGSHFLNHTKHPWPLNTKLSNDGGSYQNRFAMANVDPNQFQAILSLPMISIRTDKLVFNRSFEAYQEAMSCAFHTGLPIIPASTSRPSLSQSFSNIQLISDRRIRKTRLDDMTDKPFLLIKSKKSTLTETENDLVSKATWFWEDTNLQFYRLSPTALHHQVDTIDTDKYEVAEQDGRQVYARPGVFYRYHAFDDDNSKITFAGKGSLFSKKQPLSVFSGIVDSTVALEASFWLYIDPSYAGMPVLEYRFGIDEAQADAVRVDVRNMADIVDGWLRVSLPLEEANWHELRMLGHHITVDELLISPKDEKIKVLYDGGAAMINNFPISNKK